MTLEDFFTLTEMKNGLATLARVEELISRMQQQKDCVMTNVGDAARQWSTVASTLAATESNDCLNDFVKLNGLHFLNQWLQEALKYSNDIADSTVEELIHALLGSLEKLPIDREQSITSGVNMTIEKLLGFKGITKERARVLSERWKHVGKDVICQETVSGGACGDPKPKCSADGKAVDSSNSTCLDFDNTNCRERTREGNCGTEPVGTETHNSNVMVSHEAAELDDTNDVHSAAEQTMPSTSSITADANANLGDTNMLASSCPSNSYQEHICRTDESSVYPAAEVSSRDACDASMFKDHGAAREMNMEVVMKEGSPKSGQRDTCTVLPSPSFSEASPAQKPERSVSCNVDFKGSNYHASKTLETLPRSASVDHVAPNFLRTMDIKSVVQELHDDGSELKKGDTIETSFHTKEVVESDSEAEELGSASDLIVNKVETLSPHDFSKMGMIDQTSELGFQDGELDALEIARQVAIEVEREVVDYREPFCSSSPEGSSGEVTVEKCKQDEPVKEEVNRSGELLGKSLSGGPSSPNEGNLKSSETDFDPDTCKYETLKQTTDAYDKSHRDRFDFDLNEDLGNEGDTYSVNLVLDSSVSLSAPIAVSALKGAPLLPVAPICFEGEQGWKGSAATSAFRPASPWKTDAVKTYAGQKRKSNLIEIDLNVAERGEDDDVTPVSHGFNSLDDSMEVSSRRADRLKLDLNRLGDDDAAPDQLSYWRPPLHTSEQTMSPASSSSSRQPSMRDFDLNDNPSFFDALLLIITKSHLLRL
ncbi:Uncharacterized protein M6B38_215615 [Iris pallida]|uniref:TFIIS N-terminal domain-containing protein n=2 Tax=Iris pallida TaxID=29817 RepID=A0AAX6E0Y6_IRIPA|nr:Uncharacterized protein M6B38_215615 [Iris pallida]